MKSTFLALLLAVLAVGTMQGQAAVRKKQFNLESGIAIQGYDPVSYFVLGKATKGTSNYGTTYEGVGYYFASASNRDLFLKDPKKYEPQYGGWCAYAMGATNDKVEIDPETFKIVNGKLYLFFHNWVNNTLTKWNKNETNLKMQADKNWLLIAK